MLDCLNIYIISLKNSPRRQTCQAVVDHPPLAQDYPLRFHFHLFDAIDKHSHYFDRNLGYAGLIENSYDPKWCKRSEWFKGLHGRELSPGELGCYASHYMLWLKCIEQNKPIVILEDDFELQSNFYESVLDCLNSPFDLVRLFATFWEINPLNSVIASTDGTQVLPTDTRREIILNGHFYLSCMEVFAASAYYLTPKAAKAFVSASLHFTEPADNLLTLVHSHKIPNFTYIPLSVRFNEHHAVSTISSDDPVNLRASAYKQHKRRLFSFRMFHHLVAKIRRYYYYRSFLKQYAHLR